MPGFMCGPECQILYKNPEHPGHGSIAFVFCTEEGCNVHLDAKLGSGYFPRQRRKAKPEDCKWLQDRELEILTGYRLNPAMNTAMPRTAKQSAGTGSTHSAQKPDGPSETVDTERTVGSLELRD